MVTGDLSGALAKAPGLRPSGGGLARGHPYRDAVPVVANTREYSTGGLGYTRSRGRLTELIQGQVLHLLQVLLRLRSAALCLVVVIGDVIPVMAAWLSGRPVATYLVAYSSHYEGRLNLPWPCGSCLSHPRFQAVYSRDLLTADDLSSQLGRPVQFLGNPFMDPVLADAPLPARRRGSPLPGSRRPELTPCLFGAIQRLPAPISSSELAIDLALIRALDDAADPHRPRLAVAESNGMPHWDPRIDVRRGQFASVLQSADLVISMAGTAAEQAVGLAKPVLQMVGAGPQFTASFAEAQRRLLGPTVFCAEGNSGAASTLDASARLTLQLLERSSQDQRLQQRCRQQADERLGSMGGAARMAAAITALIKP